MNADAGYALQKLELSILDLATGPGDVRSRLFSVYINHLHVLREEDFPAGLRLEWMQIISNLTKKGPLINEDGEVIVGSLDRTLRHMRNATGTKIAKQILALCDQLRCHLGDIANV